MRRRLLKAGDRIRLKVRTITGWRGTGTVIVDMVHPDGAVRFRRDETPADQWEHCVAGRHEVALLRGCRAAKAATA